MPDADTPDAAAPVTSPGKRRSARSVIALAAAGLFAITVVAGTMQFNAGQNVIHDEIKAASSHMTSVTDLTAQNESDGAAALETAGVFKGETWETYKKESQAYNAELTASTQESATEAAREAVWFPGLRTYFESEARATHASESGDAYARGYVYLIAHAICGDGGDPKSDAPVAELLRGSTDGHAAPMVDRVLEFAADADNCNAINANPLS